MQRISAMMTHLDGQPVTLATYTVHERHIYGPSRVGMETSSVELIATSVLSPYWADASVFTTNADDRVYELTNHLGNVLATFTARKLPLTEADVVVGFAPHVTSLSDYYPFGSGMEGRTVTEGYRYGFNAMEREDDLYAPGSAYDFGARMYDGRLGRWWKMDPLAVKYPSTAPYTFVENQPIIAVGPNGKEKIIVVGNQGDSPKSHPDHFLAAGLDEAQKLKHSGELTTLMVYKGDYSDEMLNSYLKVAEDQGIKFMVFHNVDQLQEYVNETGGITGVRQDDQITDFTFIGHGGSEHLWIGNGSGTGKRALSSDDLESGYFDPSAFTQDSKVTLNSCYSCNTNESGNSNIGIAFSKLAGDKVQGTPNFVNWLGSKGKYTLNPGSFDDPQSRGLREFEGTGGDNFDIRPDSRKSWEAPSDVG